ncbi:MAG: SDR family oxidoreductase [Sphingomicrobium sp.]
MNETVVVTGASAGVGRAVALEFARNGCRVALLARGRERLEVAACEARAVGGAEALPIEVDVADAKAVGAAAERIEREVGPIGIWVNNAMATVFGPVKDLTAEEFRRVTEVTYLGQVHGTLAALRQMRPRNSGTIVQIGSALSYRAIPLQSAYCAAKFAVRGFTDALRSELEHECSAIRLSMVQLPAVNTPQFDWARNLMGRKAQPVAPIFQPEAIAREVVRAARDAPRELWIGRSALKAIIGSMLLPRVGDHILSSEGYSGQLTDQPAERNAGNLFEPAPGNPGSRGRFDELAEPTATGFDPAVLRAGALALGISGLLGLLGGAYALGRRKR